MHQAYAEQKTLRSKGTLARGISHEVKKKILHEVEKNVS